MMTPRQAKAHQIPRDRIVWRRAVVPGRIAEIPNRRRICWPNPDATCLEGGCIRCDVGKSKKVKAIWEWCATAGQVANRNGGGTKDALDAFNYYYRGMTLRWASSSTMAQTQTQAKKETDHVR